MNFGRSYSNHSVFIWHDPSSTIVLAILVDDIMLTGSDICGIKKTTDYLKQQFITKDMEKPKYFLKIKIAYCKHEVVLSQKKYALNMLEETGLLGRKYTSTPMDTDPDFVC